MANIKKIKTSEVYREALKHLWEGKGGDGPSTQFICWSIIHAAGFSSNYSMDIQLRAIPKAYRKAIRIIDDRLQPDSTIPNWLEHNGIPVYSMPYKQRLRVVQDYRRRWLESLIVEFEAKGD
jgi:hypothetical protein